MSKYKARKDLQIGDVVYKPGDIISDPPDIVGSWVLWGDAEVVEEAEEHKPVKKAVAKKTEAKKAAS
jgi:hypothetical protein